MSFLLDTEWARRLYHEHAEQMPIIDYHCHLDPKLIAEDHRFANITELWLGGDHYKWRAMRANGVAEQYITGDASPWEKFQKWAETMPYLMRNPLYHWSAMELSSAFGIYEPLTGENAREVFDHCNSLLADPGYTARALMVRYGVEVVCTTDDPADTLEWHKKIADSKFEVKVLPAWRPDKAMAVTGGQAYLDYLKKLGDAAGVEIVEYDDLIEALDRRADFFSKRGCRIADHGLSRFPYREASVGEVHSLFTQVLAGGSIDADEAEILQTALLLDLCRINHKQGWVQQFHFGPMRNVNSRMMELLGPDTGYDCIGDYRAAEPLARTLNALDSNSCLAPTILYNINPADNTWVAALCGCFQDGSRPGKIQMGAAWWFNDQLYGMEAQINALSMQGLLSRFVGMLTDSRSFLSYPRHDYFRRLLCRMLGRDLEQGLIPESQYNRVAAMVEDIAYRNAKSYFNL
ncbi:MAG: glucuronate isomerase [Bacteroidales bacterium]|nr:glucuronate isomerase [Bacteroidales bacterium]